MKRYIVTVLFFISIQASSSIVGMEKSDKINSPIKPPKPLTPLDTTRRKKVNKPLVVGPGDLFYEKKTVFLHPENKSPLSQNCSNKKSPVNNNANNTNANNKSSSDASDSIVLHDLSVLDIDPEISPDSNDKNECNELWRKICSLSFKKLFFSQTKDKDS